VLPRCAKGSASSSRRGLPSAEARHERWRLGARRAPAQDLRSARDQSGSERRSGHHGELRIYADIGGADARIHDEKAWYTIMLKAGRDDALFRIAPDTRRAK